MKTKSKPQDGNTKKPNKPSIRDLKLKHSEKVKGGFGIAPSPLPPPSPGPGPIGIINVAPVESMQAPVESLKFNHNETLVIDAVR